MVNSIVTEAIEYILSNIWDGITAEDVANHCHMSVSHFSRVFKEQTGQSVYAFIKRMKMEQSALLLKLQKDSDITDIGEKYGYSASNYSSAFRHYHKKSPSAFREELPGETKERQHIIEAMDEKIKIEWKPDYLVMYERTIGNYKDMKKKWCDFIDKYQDDITEDTIFFERTFDDPTITDPDGCIYDICMTTTTPDKYENTCILKGGKFVVYPFRGMIDQIYPLNQQLVSLWFPASHYKIDRRYSYDRYYKVEENGYMEFDICIPIE